MEKKSYYNIGKIYEVLEKYRDYNGLTITEIADRLGWKYQQYANLKRRQDRRMKASSVEHIHKCLDISMEELTAVEDRKAILDTYPPKVVKFLNTDAGRMAVLKLYGEYVAEKARREAESDIREQSIKTFKKNPQ